MTGFLALEDGTVFRGESVGADGFAFGEAVFTTAMTGYQEVVTDPSYAEQVVCFTAPMVGNYGVDDRPLRVAPPARAGGRDARGARARLDRLAARARHRRALRDRHALARPAPARGGCDARGRRRRRRLGGRGGRRGEGAAGDGRARAGTDRLGAEPYVYSDAGIVRIAVVDYGCKRSILDRLACAGAAVTVYPHDADPDELARFDGVLLSNGPGDPEPLAAEVRAVQALLGRVPVFGICLGHQLLALATGHETFKLPFGHRGANHPVLEKRTNRVLVTSQNHGFAVARSDAPEVTHVSLYDGTVEGLEFPELRASSVQFHPEARPGPHDAWPLLSRWVEGVALAEAA